MLYLIILILVIIILFLIWKGFSGGRAKAEKPPLTPPISQSETRGEAVGGTISQGETGGETNEGICAVAMGKSKEKMENKQRILEFLREKGRASNAEIRELLKVSEKTVCNYMDELEKAGEVRQVGETGKWTYYELKNINP